ncbi:putative membrane protein YuiD [Senna tora]|uniref:Putative membrane protein YuiD n=1 Tax=Senna tora TaxID=362788 RepID=A0A834X7K2_9FABA|nr:putative membrane protein YuiD [Senna tora]
MPSSHSATVTALAAAIGFQEGFGGPLFPTARHFLSLNQSNEIIIIKKTNYFIMVMYDATGVRLQAGRQAEI